MPTLDLVLLKNPSILRLNLALILLLQLLVKLISPQNAYDYPTVPTVTGGGVEDSSYYSRALPMERIALTAVAGDQIGHDEPPSYVSIIA